MTFLGQKLATIMPFMTIKYHKMARYKLNYNTPLDCLKMVLMKNYFYLTFTYNCISANTYITTYLRMDIIIT